MQNHRAKNQGVTMRIVAGKFKGRTLHTPTGLNTRPTSQRTREALFNVLQHGIEDFTLEGARVLDLFAGSGALGIEALSRGAGYCIFVDDALPARAALRENIDTLGLGGQTRIFRRDATRLNPAGNLGAFDIVFADPPYDKSMGEAALRSTLKGGWLKPDGIFVLEERKTAEIDLPEGVEVLDQRVHGEAQVVILRAV